MSDEISPESSSPENNLPINYDAIIDRFSHFVNSLEGVHKLSESQKIKIFLSVIEKDLSNVNLSADDPSVSLESVQNKFRTYCKSYRNNNLYHSYRFFTRNQLKDESFKDYYKNICDLAKPCDFNSNDVDRLIRDKVVAGLNNSDLREKVFVKGYQDLQDIVRFCMTTDEDSDAETVDYNAGEQFLPLAESSGIQDNEIKDEIPESLCRFDIVKKEILTMWPDLDDFEEGEVATNDILECKDEDNTETPKIPDDLVDDKKLPVVPIQEHEYSDNVDDAFDEITLKYTNDEVKVESSDEDVKMKSDGEEKPKSSNEENEVEEVSSSQEIVPPEVITLDSEDSEESSENKNRNRKRNRGRRIREKKVVRFRQSFLNFPKVKRLDNSKLYQPQLCDKRFNWLVKKEHEMSHVKKEKNSKSNFINGMFICTICLKSFKYKRSLNRHVKEKHKDSDSNSESESDSNLTPKLNLKKPKLNMKDED